MLVFVVGSYVLSIVGAAEGRRGMNLAVIGTDFADEAGYEAFVREVIERKRNAPAARRLADERPHLRPLPAAPVPNYTTFTCVVRRWSTIRVGKRTYSVPSRLIGHTVEARQHPTTVEVRLTARGGMTTLLVADDGCGFDPGRVAGKGGLGLATIDRKSVV